MARKVSSLQSRSIFLLVMMCTSFLSGCFGDGDQSSESQGNEEQQITLQVWHTFAAESQEEVVFERSIKSFEQLHPNIDVEITLVPYSNAIPKFQTAAIGGTAPDLVRLSSDQLGEIGEVRVNGFPLLEDLRPHLTPQQRNLYEERSLSAMRYGQPLYALPASQDCLSLIFNKALFDANGLDYPDESWTHDDLLYAAQQLTQQDIRGLAIPIKQAYWWFPFQTGFGGQLFDEDGQPSLDSNGSAESLKWMLDLELEHQIVATGTQIEGMKNQFISSKVAMIIDGPWNWANYESSRLNIGQSPLPIISETGERMSPLVSYKGWAMSKQSHHKVAATTLALWLSSESVQKEFALETYTMPTNVQLGSDPDILSNSVIPGFLEQIQYGTLAPTTREMSMIYTPLGAVFDTAYAGADPDEALKLANQALLSDIQDLERSSEPKLQQGYRTINVSIPIENRSTFQLLVDGELHTEFYPEDDQHSPFQAYDSCIDERGQELKVRIQARLIEVNGTIVTCELTGMVPGVEHLIQAQDESGIFFEIISSTSVVGELPPEGDASPILFALGALVLSLVILLGFARYRDVRRKPNSSHLAHFYIAPALLCLVVLTFYPVMYGFWLSFTDADQTRLGDESFIGLMNFIEVLTAEGFVRVTLFTLIWTVVNVFAHVTLGLILALVLQQSSIKGKTMYRTMLLLPWAIPSYISVLIWKGMFQPDGFVNLMLGTNIDFLSDPNGAQILVIFVNIWLGVPFMMMSLSGALQSLPKEMYEAATIDGVSSFDTFVHITLPNLKTAIVPLVLLGFIWTFNMFNVIYLLTDGGPNLYYGQPGQTDILITYVYDVAFRDGAYGVAAAWSVIIFLMLSVFSYYYMNQTKATEGVT